MKVLSVLLIATAIVAVGMFSHVEAVEVESRTPRMYLSHIF